MADKDSLSVKLIDFGLSGQTLSGITLAYAAPEIINASESEDEIPVDLIKGDMWSLGIMLYAMVFGKIPCAPVEDLGSWPSFPNEISVQLEDLLRRLLSVNVNDRLSSEDLISHPWLSSSSVMQFRISKLDIDNMERFVKSSDFARICAVRAARCLSFSAISKLHESFVSLDTDRNGLISLSEFKAGFTKSAGQSDSEIEALFEGIDIDGNGQIEYSEFVAASLDYGIASRETAAQEIFCIVDSSNTGYTTKDDIISFFTQWDVSEWFTEQDIDRFIEGLSENQSISRSSFCSRLTDSNDVRYSVRDSVSIRGGLRASTRLSTKFHVCDEGLSLPLRARN